MVDSIRHLNTHHYAIDTAKLVDKCRSLLHSVLDVLESNSSARAFQRRSFQLMTLGDALKCVDRLIHNHLLDLLDREMEFLSSINESDAQLFFGEHIEFPTLMDTVKTLQCAERVAREYRGMSNPVGFDGIMTDNSRSRICSTHLHPAVALPGGGLRLSIDDPIEEEYSAQGWYSGGRRSPSSPRPLSPLQSAGDSSPPKIHHRQSLHIKGGNTGVPALPYLSSPMTKHSRSNNYCPSRSAKDSSLFRLIVTLQLCLVRIEESNSVICKGQARAAVRLVGRSRSGSFQSNQYIRRDSNSSDNGIQTSTSDDSEASQALYSSCEIRNHRYGEKLAMSIALGGSAFLIARSEQSNHKQSNLLNNALKAVAGVATASLLRKRWRILCMNARLANSECSIEDWIFHWICLRNNNESEFGAGRLLASRKPVFWYSNGSIRFQLMKRGMDLVYASIGKAIEITGGKVAEPDVTSKSLHSSSLWTYVVASLAASYYSVIGPNAKAASSLENAPSCVIQNAWGMVSLPAVKKASLEATRILKGAAIADRIEICGVSCFVLSQEPFPALSSALRRYRRQQNREDFRLGTIHEKLSSHPSSVNVKGFQKCNIILHLTGGGFFAHTIAGDLPYLLDWSATSKAVIIVPEYALFPHKFPDAITEISQVYRALRYGQAATLLGFQPDRIVVSGESVGGNLAAALCVSMVIDYEKGQCKELSHCRSEEIVNDIEDTFFAGEREGGNTRITSASGFSSESRFMGLELPDALMLCCPVLNLSLDPTPSRIDGQNDPVLPSALIKTISNSYLDGCPVTDPVASPYFASDSIIQNFPPTYMYTSSEDPFLDDSVAFNGRLRSVGVKSSLRAAHDLPHAFWALSTAGIPEARQVQRECSQWLSKIFCSS